MTIIPAKNLQPSLKGLPTKSALNPALWFCAIVSIPLYSYSLIASGEKSNYAFWIACIPVAITSLLLLYYGILRPDLLQSEGYRLRDTAMRIFGDSARKSKEISSIIEGEYTVTQEEIVSAVEGER
jgi:hypothetical protein